MAGCHKSTTFLFFFYSNITAFIFNSNAVILLCSGFRISHSKYISMVVIIMTDNLLLNRQTEVQTNTSI